MEQSKAPAATPPPTVTTTPAVTHPPKYTEAQIAEWQEKAKDADKYKGQYENLLPEFTRKSQALAHLTGAQIPQQQQDPLAPYLKWAQDNGYDAESAKGIAQMAMMIANDQTNRAMQQYQYNNVGNQIPIVMNQAYSLAPQALNNPKVQEELRKDLMNLANQGEFGLINPDYAANRAKIIAFDQGLFVPGAQQAPPQAPPNPNIPSMWGIPTNGFSPQPAPAEKAKTSLQLQQAQDLASRFPGLQVK